MITLLPHRPARIRLDRAARRRGLTRRLAGGGLAALAALLLAACSKPAPVAYEEPPRPVRTTVIAATPVVDAWALAGEVRPRIEIRYGFRVGGRLIERKVEVGDRVVAGELLARLDPQDLQPQLDAQRAQQEAARTELALARAELARSERLRAGNFVSDANVDRQRAQVDAAKARLEAAAAQVNQARNSIGFQQLKADSAGVVTAIDAEAGQVVAVGQSVVRVANAGDVEVVINVPEQSLGRVRAAKSWQVTLSGLPGRQWPAMLRELSPAADPASRTYAARLSLAGALDDVALGMSAVATANGEAAAQIRVPLTALHSRDGGAKVWIVDPASATVRARPIETGALLDDAVVVVKGLAGGETVVTAGANLLREGQKVRVAAATASAAPVAGGQQAAR
ncbi:MAG: efflux RND transporter periplasmic adaptor subunit [Lautropia sp.]